MEGCCAKLHQCLLLLLLLLHFLASHATTRTLVQAQPQVPCFFIFGDSLVDNGNNIYRNTASKADYLPYGIDFPEGPTGRYNNGRNTADLFAEMLGFDRYIPPFAEAAAEDFLRGLNYGSGGAGILDETGDHLGAVISMNEQLLNHQVVVTQIAELLGGEIAAEKHLRKCLYYVEMGNNDYLSNYFPKFYNSATPQSPQQFAALAIDEYSKQLMKLYGLGARKLAVSGVGRLGCVPHEIAVHGSFLNDSDSCLETSNDIAGLFNERLQLLINNLNHRFPDAKFVYTSGKPDRPETSFLGNISIMRVPCCAVTPDGMCIPDTIPCSNRDEHMFWDSFHPTEAATLIFAKNDYKKMAPLFSANSIAIL
ncbi:GDSL esterase/lipase At1g29670-like [Andrographis paniculata]|uniref:GDSL esterase/lipase At1g29670-like n=1 Tax=Andrographis paniculata TaxID=175694 RepID=UPI0021E71128|nr:GDSL esterase/lipase At1g29670-like [Andrographis paniculata]